MKWVAAFGALMVASLVHAGLVRIGVIEPQRYAQAPRPPGPVLFEATKPAEAATQRSTPTPTIKSDDARLRLPSKIAGYALTGLGSSMAGNSDSSARAEYTASNGTMAAVLWVERTGEPLPPSGKKVKVGEQNAVQTTNGAAKEVATVWRAGQFIFKLFAKPEGGSALASIAAPALAFSAEVNKHASSVSSLDEGDRSSRLTALNGAVDLSALRMKNVKAFASRAPGWVVSVKPTQYSRNGLTATVQTLWLALPTQVRETQARQLWKEWALASTPANLDDSHITLEDVNGHKVGGSGIMGSSVSVD